MAFTLQLKRHVNYENKGAALEGLKAYLAKAAVGEPAIATYGGGETIDPEKVLFGIKGAEDYTIFDYEAIPADVQAALDAIKGEGYDEDGTYATLKAIADALTIINGVDTVEGSIAKAEQDAKDYADGQITAAVQALNVADTAVAKSFVTQVSETDGKIVVKRGAVTSTGGTIVLTDGEDGGINIDVVSTALTITGKDAIKVAESGTGKEISLAISANDKVLSQTTDGLLATFAIAKLGSANEGMAASYQLQDKTGNPMGVTIDIPKDMVISAAEVKKVEQADQPYSGAVVGDMYIDFTIANATSDHIYLPAKTLFDAYVQGNGIEINGNKIAVKLDAATEKFLTVGADGIKLSGVQAAIDGAVSTAKTELQDKIDTVEASVGLSADGAHVATRGNYTSGASTIAGEIAALDAQVKKNADAIADEKTRATQKEGELETAIAAEKTRATAAEQALQEAIDAVEGAAISVVAGKGISVTSDGTAKTIAAVAKADDPVIEVTAAGIGVKEDAVIDCGTYA